MSARAGIELACALAWFVLSGAALAQTPDWTINDLMRALSQRDHTQAEFTEAKYMRLLSRPLNLRGTLSYRAPDRLEKHTLQPNEEIMLVEGDKLRIQIPVRRIDRTFTMHELPVVWGFVESLRATLSGDRKALERIYSIELEGEVRNWQLTLRPRDPKMARVISEIQIGGAGGRVASFELREAGGDRSVMRIREAQP
jgi:outer membrane lipoprotein-sorting protein